MKTITGILACLMVGLIVVPDHAAAETMMFQEGVSPTSAYTADAGTIQFCVAYIGCDSVQDTVIGGGALQVGGEPPYREHRFLLEFPLSPIKEKIIRELGESKPVTIDHVRLVLTQNPYPNLSYMTIDVRQLGMNDGQSYDFHEEQVTWNNAPRTPGGTIGPRLQRLSFEMNTEEKVPRTWESTWAFVRATQRALSQEDQTFRLMVTLAPGLQDDTVVSFMPNAMGAPHSIKGPNLIVDYHIGLPLLKLSPLMLTCLKVPQLCQQEIMATGSFQEFHCAVEQFACGQLIQALEIVQRRGAPPLEAFFPKAQGETTPERRSPQKGDTQQ